MPASIAWTIGATQWSTMKPPELATPTIMVRHPASLAWATLTSWMPRSALQPGRRSWPKQRSGRQSLIPCAVLAASWSATSPRKRRKGGSMGPSCRNGTAAMVGDLALLPQCRLPARLRPDQGGSHDR